MSLFNGHAERVAESVWLRLVARAAMAIGLPVLGFLWWQVVDAQRETAAEIKALRSNLDTLAATVAVRVEVGERERDRLDRRVERIEDRLAACCSSSNPNPQ